MGIEEKKKQLHQFIDNADEEITNVMMEVITEYHSAKNPDIPQEWIDEAIERSKEYKKGGVKTYTIEEVRELTAAIFKSKLNAVYPRSNH